MWDSGGRAMCASNRSIHILYRLKLIIFSLFLINSLINCWKAENILQTLNFHWQVLLLFSDQCLSTRKHITLISSAITETSELWFISKLWCIAFPVTHSQLISKEKFQESWVFVFVLWVSSDLLLCKDSSYPFVLFSLISYQSFSLLSLEHYSSIYFSSLCHQQVKKESLSFQM